MRRRNPFSWLQRKSCVALCVLACVGGFGQAVAQTSAASTATTSAPAASVAGETGAGEKKVASAPEKTGSGVKDETAGKNVKDTTDQAGKVRLGVGLAIACIALCGAIGGFVDGLGTNLRYRLTVPSFHRVKYRVLDSGATHLAASESGSSRIGAGSTGGEGGIVSDTKGFVASEIELGSVGDALVGVVAAFSVFVVSSAVFPGTNTSQVLEMGLINLIGWSLVAGYLGPRLLRLIAEKSGNIEKAQKVANEASEAAKAATSKVQIAEKKGDIAEAEAKAAKDQAKAVTMSIRATAQASPLLEQAQRLLTMNEVAGVMKPPVDAQDRKTRYLDKAEAMFKLALKRSEGQGADVGAMIGLANTYYGMADLVDGAADSADALQYWKKGIETLEAALAADPKSAKTRYNLACFKAKANTVPARHDTYPPDEIFADLRKAYELEQEFQQYAYSDDDFSALRSMQPPPKADDLKLIKGPTPAVPGPAATT